MSPPTTTAFLCLLPFLTAASRGQVLTSGHYERAARLYDEGRFEDAIEEIRIGLEIDDATFMVPMLELEGWCLLRVAMEQNGSLATARIAFERALELAGSGASPQLLLGYGMCRLELGKLQRSEADQLRESLKDPGLVGPDLIRARRRLRDLEEEVVAHLEAAGQYLQALVDREAPFIEALVSLMETRVLQQDPEAAEQIGNSVLEECKEQQAYWRAEMAGTNSGGYAREAAAQFRASVDREILIRETMVGVHLARGAEDMAVAQVVRYLELDPGHPLGLQSVIALRYGRDPGQSAILALVRAAERPDGSRELRSEALTSLGILGPAANNAIPALEKLVGHEDPQIAERAKAALRQIKGRSGAPSLTVSLFSR